MEEVGTGIIKGLGITFIGVLTLTVIGGMKAVSTPTARATAGAFDNAELVASAIVLMGIITTLVYDYAHRHD